VGIFTRLQRNYSIALERATKENSQKRGGTKTRAEKKQALRVIMKYYAGPVAVFEAARLDNVRIIKMRINGLAGEKPC
jgi:hypothetical protein